MARPQQGDGIADFGSALANVGISVDPEEANTCVTEALKGGRVPSSSQGVMQFCIPQCIFNLCHEAETPALDGKQQQEKLLSTLRHCVHPGDVSRLLTMDAASHGDSHIRPAELKGALGHGAGNECPPIKVNHCSVKLRGDEPAKLGAVCGLLYSSRSELEWFTGNCIDIRFVFRSDLGAAQFMNGALPYLCEEHSTSEVQLPVLQRIAPQVRSFRTLGVKSVSRLLSLSSLINVNIIITIMITVLFATIIQQSF